MGVARSRPRHGRRSRRSPPRRTAEGAARTSARVASSSSASAHPIVSNSSTEKPISAAWAATSVATATWPRSTLHRKADRRLASSARTQSTSSRQPGPFQRSHRAAASAAKWAACRSRTASRSASVRELLVGEGPDGLEQAVPGRGRRPWWATTSDLRTSESRSRRVSTSSLASATAHARPEVEAAGEHRRRAAAARARRRPAGRTDHATACRRVDCRSGPCSGPVSSRNRSPSRSRTSAALIAAIRAAASSMPSGMPSSVSQISTTAAAVRSSKMPKPGRAAPARSTNRVTASEVTPPSSASGDDRDDRLAGDQQRLPRRRHDPWRVGAGDDAADRRRGRREHVLAVVDHDEQAPPGHRLGDGVDHGHVALRGDAEGVGDGVGHGVGIVDRRQLDQPDPVGELVGELGRRRPGPAASCPLRRRRSASPVDGRGPASATSGSTRRRARSGSWPTSAGSRARTSRLTRVSVAPTAP